MWVKGSFTERLLRYERRADIYESFTLLQASIITLNQIHRFC
jgi:hypothetical protein